MKWPATYHLNNRQHQYENMFRCPRSEASFASEIVYIPMVKKMGLPRLTQMFGDQLSLMTPKPAAWTATFGIPTCRLKSKDSKVNHISKENSSLHLAASWLFSPGHVEVSNPWGHPIQVMDDHDLVWKQPRWLGGTFDFPPSTRTSHEVLTPRRLNQISGRLSVALAPHPSLLRGRQGGKDEKETKRICGITTATKNRQVNS